MVDVGGIGEERHLVLVVAARVGAVLVRPVHHGRVLPVASAVEDTLVVHEVRDVGLVVFLQVGVVGEHAEAAELALRLLQLVERQRTGISGAGDATGGIGVEAHGVLAVGGRPGGRLVAQRLTVAGGTARHQHRHHQVKQYFLVHRSSD